jgi:hypothetical protein
MSKQFLLSYVASVDLSDFGVDCDTPEEVIELLKSHFGNNVGQLLDERANNIVFQTALVQEVIDEDTAKLLSVAWIKPEWNDE